MKMTRDGWAAAAVGVAGLVLILGLAYAPVPGASAQVGGFGKPLPVVVAGGVDSVRWAYRVWSDGRVELNDINAQVGGQDEMFKGWREVK